ncbi:MAG TPA: hypothetical protein ENN43_02290, partial [bacterium]|nr:hypothetical protein [bacterium]
DGNIYKSTNGGQSWVSLGSCGGAGGGGIIKVIPANGWVIAGNSTGLWRSKDKGASWQKLQSWHVNSLDTIHTYPESVYVTNQYDIYKSTNGGDSWIKLNGAGLPSGRYLVYCRVSPANPNRMLVDTHGAEWWNLDNYYSHDGGNTWARVKIDMTNSFFKMGNRALYAAWHPTDANIAIGCGSADYMNKSFDGGKTFGMSSNGYTAIAATGYNNFASDNPNIYLSTTQDYGAAVTLDGGNTWKWLKPDGTSYGGYAYGGYAVDATTWIACMAPGWWKPTIIYVTHNGGASWVNTGVDPGGSKTGLSVPGKPNIIFIGNKKSTDKGYTWSSSGVDGVYTYNPQNKALVGLRSGQVVYSTNDGFSWTGVGSSVSGAKDVAVDWKNSCYYVAAEYAFWKINFNGSATNIIGSLPASQNNERKVQTVATDPVNPDIVYAGYYTGLYLANNTLVRSVDGGKTWESMVNNTAKFGSGGEMPSFVRVNPLTRYLHSMGGCFGLWKISPPDAVITPTVEQTPGNTATNTPVVTPTATPMPSAVAVECGQGIVIDGSISDAAWQDGMWMTNNRLITGTNPQNVTSKFKVRWDNTNLYVAVDVTDPSPNNDSGTAWYDDSSVEVYLDMNHNRSVTYGTDDFQFSMRYNDQVLREINGKTSGAAGAVGARAGGYVVEMRLPWALLGVMPVQGAVYGLDIGVNIDSNGGAREGVLMWNGTSSNWQNTAAFGDAVLGAACTAATATNTAVPPTATNTAVPPTATVTTPVPTNTPVLPTATPTTPVPTNTPVLPTATVTIPVAANLTIKVKSANTNDSTNSPNPHMQVVNSGTSAINLNNAEARYWFNCDCTGQSVQAVVDWAGKMPQGISIGSNVSVSVAATTLGGQTHYISVKFSGDIVLQPGEYVEFHLRFHKSDWSNMTQSNDWSYTNSQSWQSWTKATAYYSGSLVWGQEPASTALPAEISSVMTYPNPATSQTGAYLEYSIETNGSGVSTAGNNEMVYAIDPSSKVYLKIFSRAGRLIWQKELEGVYYLTTGTHKIKWDGRAAGGKELGAGMYILKAELKMKEGSSTALTSIIMMK